MSVIEAVREGTAWTAAPPVEIEPERIQRERIAERPTDGEGVSAAVGGGAPRVEVDVEAVVRAFYGRVRRGRSGDDDAPVPDFADLGRWVAADARVLSGVLATPSLVRPVAPGLLLTRPDLVARHLGAALLDTGVPRATAMAAAIAFTRATGHAVVLEAVRETGAPSGT